jgi:hypothetical protein
VAFDYWSLGDFLCLKRGAKWHNLSADLFFNFVLYTRGTNQRPKKITLNDELWGRVLPGIRFPIVYEASV